MDTEAFTLTASSMSSIGRSFMATLFKVLANLSSTAVYMCSFHRVPKYTLMRSAVCSAVQGMVHITDAVLQPPTEGLQMKAVRHALSGLEAMVAMASAHKARGSCRRSQKVWQRPNANDDVYREAAVQLGRGRIASEVCLKKLGSLPYDDPPHDKARKSCHA